MATILLLSCMELCMNEPWGTHCLLYALPEIRIETLYDSVTKSEYLFEA